MDSLEYKRQIAEDDLRNIEKNYEIRFIDIQQLFAGADQNTFVYKAESINKKFYFLKIRAGEFIDSSVTIPYLLSKKTGKHIIEPVMTKTNSLFLELPGYTVILYPFISGKSGKERDLNEQQWIEFGKLLYEVHSHEFPDPAPEIPRETFDTKWSVSLRKCMDDLERITVRNGIERHFVNMLMSRKSAIDKILTRTNELVREIAKRDLKYCLCHGDIHAANIFITDNDNFYIVDWDTLILAPKERDLMFIGGGVADKWNTAEEENLFYRGYGKYDEVNYKLLAYYRYYRIIEDIVVYYEQFFEENIPERNQKTIIERVDSNFWPGATAEMADMAYQRLSST